MAQARCETQKLIQIWYGKGDDGYLQAAARDDPTVSLRLAATGFRLTGL